MENSPFTRLNAPANIWYPMTSYVEPFSKYFPVKIHISPASRIPSEAPASVSNKSDKQVACERVSVD